MKKVMLIITLLFSVGIVFMACGKGNSGEDASNSSSEISLTKERNEIELYTEEIPSDAIIYVNSVFEEMVNTASNVWTDKNLGIQKDGGEIYLGKGFTSYIMEEGKLEDGDGIAFPVIQDNKIVLILMVFPTESGWAVTTSYDVAEKLNEMRTLDINEPSIVIYDKYGAGYVLNKEFTLFNGNEIDKDSEITFDNVKIRKKMSELNVVDLLERL